MKKNLVTRILCFLLVLTMLVTVLPLTIFAEEIGDATNDTPTDTGTELPEEGEEEEIDLSTAVDVTTADELEAELALGTPIIRIVADFAIDRSFYVTADTIIFTDEAHTLTRASDFGGDVFVIGEDKDGVRTEAAVTLTLGSPLSTAANMLVVDGNSAAMSVDVIGSVIFVVEYSRVDLYHGVTIKNATKVGNERVVEHTVSYHTRTGGAIAIVTNKAVMNIYGGSYLNSGVNDITDTSTEEGMLSSYGGAFYNYGTLSVYGGLFEGNHAARGGAFYNYRTMNIYRATIRNNTSSTLGGAIYVPASTVAYTYIGEENDVVEPEVLFEGNSATGAGAIYLCNVNTIKNTTFRENTATTSYGGALQLRSAKVKIEGCVFIDNSAVASQGGAIYATGSNDDEEERELEISDTAFISNEAKKNGGVLYVSGNSRVYISGGSMNENSAGASAGCVYATSSVVDLNGIEITGNTAVESGGAVVSYNGATVKMNKIVASENTTNASGGFAHAEDAHIEIYNSTLSDNYAKTNGGAVCIWYREAKVDGETVRYGATGNIYATTFKGNTSDYNGGALATYPYATLDTLVHSCTFEGNTAANFGGAIWSSGKSQIDLYNITATKNHAANGGFFYFTAAGSVATIVGLTLSGNTDDNGGPIIWGNTYNAKLYIDKLKYVDKDYDGDWNDEYWAAAIYNKLTIYEITGEVPSYEDYGTGEIIKPAPPVTATDVSTAAALERALEVGYGSIRITADFEIDRTFYVKASATIFSSRAVKLTRAADFGGDIFVIGRDANGKSYKGVTLTLGKEDSDTADMLTIDGNRDSMTVDVVGTVLYVCYKATALLYPNLTITNCKKVGNSIVTGDEVSYPENTGGAVAIVTKSSTMDIYGGKYTNNASNDVVDGDYTAAYGGAFYNYGVLTVYNGTFSGNRAGRGGAFYNYRTLYIYNATISDNSASTYGGAIYMPNSTAAFTYIGESPEGAVGNVVFRSNSATNGGGAIYARNYMSVKNTLFDANSTDGTGGAIMAGKIELRIVNSELVSNTAVGHGGAIYMEDVNGSDNVYDISVHSSVFSSNASEEYGGALYMYSKIRGYIHDTDFDSNTAVRGAAVYMTGANLEINGSEMTGNTTSGTGGAWAIYSNSYALANNITATGNVAGAMGGFAYVQASTFDLYNSTVKNNSASSHGGGIAIYYKEASENTTLANIYATTFEGNTSGSNGGAIAIYPRNESCTLIHSCTFNGNTASNFGGGVWISGPGQMKMYNTLSTDNHAGSGGFAYITTAGTIARIVGLTISGNTDDNGGPIIWGNTANAKLYIDKSQYTDLDESGSLTSTYWKKAIYNKLTVYDVSEEIPKYLDYGNEAYENMSDAVDVSAIEALEAEILKGTKHIRIVADIEIDRTLYITGDVTIFSTISRTLTRATDFTGDIFVIGEDKDGVSSLLNTTNAKLTLGNPQSVLKNLLIIDGNGDNMAADVVGTVLFIANSSKVELYDNVTMINHKKLGNERAYDENYKLSSVNRIGGAVAIIASGTLNVYGGDYSYNSTRVDEVIDENDTLEVGRSSTNGGLFFNSSNLNIYGGTFSNNAAPRGAIVYNYRVVKIRGGEFYGNSASSTGGVYYAPNSSQAHLYVGSYNGDDGEVIFDGNSSKGHGGVLYISTLSAAVIYGHTSFTNNRSTDGAGGAICAYGSLTVRGSEFIGNTARTRGGAIYASNSSADSVTRITEITNTLFEGNMATNGGALALYASSLDFPEGAIARISGSTFRGNSASLEAAGASTAVGGAIHADRKVSLWVGNSTLEGNSAATEGGAIYLASLSMATIEDSIISTNSSGKHGGAITLRSSTLAIDGTTITGNTAQSNGGAVYVSYQSNIDANSTLSITGSTISANESEGNGGAIYFTRRNIDGVTDKEHLRIKDTDFISNRAANGGAMFTVADVMVYLKNVQFEANSADKTDSGIGGAYYIAGSIVEMDGATFTSNSATASGGAVSIDDDTVIVMNAITASKNSAGNLGGFIYAAGGAITIYNSEVLENTAVKQGGAIYLAAGVTADIYNTAFKANEAGTNGAALAMFTNGAEVVLYNVTLENNNTTELGTIYISGKSFVNAYNLTATGNTAQKGAFLYVTTTGTVLNLKGATVSGNTASVGGPIIWGNSTGAKLFIDKTGYTDLDYTGELDDSYWSAAIVNLLTVEETTIVTPTHEEYEPRVEVVPAVKNKAEVSVDEIFNLAEGKVSSGSISSYYNKLPVLDNSSNFMSDGVSTFENINGTTVTVDNFIYQYKTAEGNGTVGEGLLIYQAMLYKRANPDVDVSISLSAYRVSVSAAVNINRNSRYFGYMRNMPAGLEYDAYGFVRVSYLLVSAAKMGINVTVIGQLDGYPIPSGDQNLDDYFTTRLDTPCDSNYASGKVSDYMNYKFCYWTLHEKGGTDMMHTKLCAVSHYLDMNGVAHENAVFTSSSNLDGITGQGYNGNYNLQTSTIISDHAEIYRISKNYLDLIAEYCEQEAIYEWQDIMQTRNKEQMDLILAGRGDEIPEDEQIVYLGTENDDVFEMYFTPFGGDTAVWDPVYQPYSKYINEMYNSEGPIIFAFNVAEHSNSFAFGAQMDMLLVAAFHNNKSPENRFYVNMESFDGSTMADLKVGVDIGTLSINKMEYKGIHNKDILLSYVKDGQRYYVSLLNSCNFHSGSMSYQSNFMLVIKERELKEDGVFFTMADNTTNGVVEHTYGEEKVYLPDDTTVHGYTYRECVHCGKQLVTGVTHRPGEWIIDREAEVGTPGLKHKECTACGTITEVVENIVIKEALEGDLVNVNGVEFNSNTSSLIDTGVSGSILTIEAVLQLSSSVKERAGVIVGNYSYSRDDFINLEIYDKGQVRLTYRSNGVGRSYVFSADIRGEDPVHIAVTVDERIATLYINGSFSESVTIDCDAPINMTGFVVGGDNRYGNTQYFKGRIYSVAMFSDARSADEILEDMIAIPADTDALLYARSYTSRMAELDNVEGGGISFDGDKSIELENIAATPLTLEAIISLGAGTTAEGVIVGNEAMSLRAMADGVMLSYTVDGTEYALMLYADIDKGMPLHIAVTIDGMTALLYINGAVVDTAELECELPDASGEFTIGDGFVGTIYAIGLFSDVRNAAEIARDSILVPSEDDELLYSAYLKVSVSEDDIFGERFTADSAIPIGDLDVAPHTFEAVIRAPKNIDERIGVIVGNYDGSTDVQVNMEIYSNGKPRLYIQKGYETLWCVFQVDIRSDKPVHIAITIDGDVATLYVDGVMTATNHITLTMPEGAVHNLVVGGDNRTGNTQYFKGEIYSVRIFSDVRSAKEIKDAAQGSAGKGDGLLYSEVFAKYSEEKNEGYRPVGITPDSENPIFATSAYDRPLTMEALVSLDKDFDGRGGIVIGNYTGGSEDQINLEIYTEGRVRLFYRNAGKYTDCIFSCDVRRGSPVHIAVVIDGPMAKLYINGQYIESKALLVELPEIQRELIVGMDYRYRLGNETVFKGEIYSINIFSVARDAEQISADARFVPSDADGLVYSLLYGKEVCDATTVAGNHIESDWIIDREATEERYGAMHTECVECGKVLLVKEIPNASPSTNRVVYDSNDAMSFGNSNDAVSVGTLVATPKTYEFVLGLPLDYSARAGVVFGNFKDTTANSINVEIYTNGVPRFFFYEVGRPSCSVFFNADVRTAGLVHMAITIDGTEARLYLDGELIEVATLDAVPPNVVDNFMLGSDRRVGVSEQPFKGEIYAVNIFGDVRTAEEIKYDAIKVSADADNLLYSYYSGLVTE